MNRARAVNKAQKLYIAAESDVPESPAARRALDKLMRRWDLTENEVCPESTREITFTPTGRESPRSIAFFTAKFCKVAVKMEMSDALVCGRLLLKSLKIIGHEPYFTRASDFYDGLDRIIKEHGRDEGHRIGMLVAIDSRLKKQCEAIKNSHPLPISRQLAFQPSPGADILGLEMSVLPGQAEVSALKDILKAAEDAVGAESEAESPRIRESGITTQQSSIDGGLLDGKNVNLDHLFSILEKVELADRK